MDGWRVIRRDLVPNLLTGNIDATVIYSPLSYKLFIEKTARSLIDFGTAVPPNMTAAWMAKSRLMPAHSRRP